MEKLDFFFFNSPARDAASWFSGRVSDGAAVVCVGDKEGSGLRSPRDAPLSSCALHWAHPGSRGANKAQMAAGPGGSWSDGREQCRRSRPGASGTALVRAPGRGACGARCAACTSRGCRTPELVKTAKADVCKTGSEDGGCGGTRPSGEEAESPVSDRTSPTPSRAPDSPSRPSGPAVPGPLAAARDAAAGGESRARPAAPGSSAARKGALVPRTSGRHPPDRRPLRPRPSPAPPPAAIGLDEKVPACRPRGRREREGAAAASVARRHVGVRGCGAWSRWRAGPRSRAEGRLAGGGRGGAASSPNGRARGALYGPQAE